MPEYETIFVEISEEGVRRYFPIEARCTEENFFEIVSKPPVGHSGSFRCSDIVRRAWRCFGKGFDGGGVAIAQADSSLPDFLSGTKY